MINRGIDKINIGMFTQKIQWLRPELRKNARGAVETTYVEDAYAFAMVENTATTEMEMQMNLSDQPTIKITTYFKAGVTTAWIVRVDEEDYNINSVQSIFGQPLMTLTATKKK